MERRVWIMANNYGTYQAEFKPYSFDELIKPVLMADQEHKLIEAGLGEIDAKRALVEGDLDSERDVIASQRHEDYLNSLLESSSTLAHEGIRGLNRKNLMDLRTAYASQIVPIEKAVQARHALAQMENQKAAQDDSTIFTRRAQDISVDEFLANPHLNPQSVSGRNLHAESAQAFSHLSKRLRAEGFSQAQVEGYLRLYKSRGRTEKEALDAMLGQGAGDEFQAIFNNIAQSYGIDQWEEGAAKNKAMDNIYRGALASIGTDDTNYMGDRVWEQEQINKRQTAPRSGEEEPTRHYGILSGKIAKKRELDNSQKPMSDANNQGFMNELVESINAQDEDGKVAFWTEGTTEKERLRIFEKAVKNNSNNTQAYKNMLQIGDYSIEEFLPQSDKELTQVIKKLNDVYTANTIRTTEYKLNVTDPENAINNIYQNVISAVSPSAEVGSQPKEKGSTTFNKRGSGIKKLGDDGVIGKEISVGDFYNYVTKGTTKDKEKGEKPRVSFSYADGEHYLRMNVSSSSGTDVLLVPVRHAVAQLDINGQNVANAALKKVHQNRIFNDLDGYMYSVDEMFSSMNADPNSKMPQQAKGSTLKY